MSIAKYTTRTKQTEAEMRLPSVFGYHMGYLGIFEGAGWTVLDKTKMIGAARSALFLIKALQLS